MGGDRIQPNPAKRKILFDFLQSENIFILQEINLQRISTSTHLHPSPPHHALEYTRAPWSNRAANKPRCRNCPKDRIRWIFPFGIRPPALQNS